MSEKIRVVAQNPVKGMTLEELQGFINTAYSYGAEPDAGFLVDIGWKAQIKSLKMEVPLSSPTHVVNGELENVEAVINGVAITRAAQVSDLEGYNALVSGVNVDYTLLSLMCATFYAVSTLSEVTGLTHEEIYAGLLKGANEFHAQLIQKESDES